MITPLISTLACGVALLWPSVSDPVIDGGHHVSITETDGVAVQTEWISAGVGAPVIKLAFPLPEDASLEGADVERDDAGVIIAVVTHDADVSFEVRVPLSRVQALGAVPLALPSNRGTHRVTFDAGVAFDPHVDLGLSPRLTRAATANVAPHPTRWLDPSLTEVPPGSGVVRYATVSDLRRSGGFVGQLERGESRRRRLLLFAGATFLLVVAALVAAYRSLRRGAAEERVDQLLAEEIEALAAK